MSEGDLAVKFGDYGPLEKCKIVVDMNTLRSKCFGFVKFVNPSDADKARIAFDKKPMDGKILKVAFARRQCKAITNSNLFIQNIPLHLTTADLRDLFNEYGMHSLFANLDNNKNDLKTLKYTKGKIIECRVLKNDQGESRGRGFVRLDTHHNAIQALQAKDQYVIDDRYPPLSVKV